MRISDWSSDVCSSDLPQRRDVDVDIGQQRLSRVGHRLEFGQAQDIYPLRARREHIDMVRQAGKGTPVATQFGRGQETPPGIGQRKGAQNHLDIERYGEAATAESHPGPIRIFSYLGD